MTLMKISTKTDGSHYEDNRKKSDNYDDTKNNTTIMIKSRMANDRMISRVTNDKSEDIMNYRCKL